MLCAVFEAAEVCDFSAFFHGFFFWKPLIFGKNQAKKSIVHKKFKIILTFFFALCIMQKK